MSRDILLFWDSYIAFLCFQFCILMKICLFRSLTCTCSWPNSFELSAVFFFIPAINLFFPVSKIPVMDLFPYLRRLCSTTDDRCNPGIVLNNLKNSILNWVLSTLFKWNFSKILIFKYKVQCYLRSTKSFKIVNFYMTKMNYKNAIIKAQGKLIHEQM